MSHHDINHCEKKWGIYMTGKNTASQASALHVPGNPVNPRTGCVEASYTLAAISSGLQSPATFALTLTSTRRSTSANQSVDGFGLFWDPSVPRIEKPTKTIVFTDGSSATFKADPTTDVTLNYRKLKDVKIELTKDTANNITGWVVTHKNHTVEYYDNNGVISRVVSASGNYLNFTSEPWGSEHFTPKLTKVQDGNGNKIDIDYQEADAEGNYPIVVTETIHGEVRTTRVILEDNGAIKSITNRGNINAVNTFTYINIDGVKCIETITAPTGAKQTFTYGKILYVKTPAEITTPVVVQVDIKSSNTADTSGTVIQYGYGSELPSSPSVTIDAKNFTGYPIAVTPSTDYPPEGDNCIRKTDEYTYYVTEIHQDIKIARSYNRFHLQTAEVLASLTPTGTVSWTRFTYGNMTAGANIDGQGVRFASWTQKTISYQNSSATGTQRKERKVTDQCTVDDYGNVTSLLSGKEEAVDGSGTVTVLSKGILTTNTYYPANSTVSAGCPPTIKNYFVSYLKESVVKPDVTTPPASLIQTYAYTYALVNGYDYTVPAGIVYTKTRPYMVLVSKNTLNTTEMSSLTYYSADETLAKTFYAGTEKTFSVPSPSRKGDFKIAYTYETQVDPDSSAITLVKKTETHTSTDSSVTPPVVKLSKHAATTFSLASGVLRIEEAFRDTTSTDPGAKTTFRYDSENRVTQRVLYAGSTPDVSQTESYAYTYFSPIDTSDLYSQNTVVTNTTTGLKRREYINYLGQLVRVQEDLLGNSSWVTTNSYTYFSSGLLKVSTIKDTVKNTDNSDKTLSLSTDYTYYARELLSVKAPDGAVTKYVRDRVLNTLTSADNNETMSILTTYNVSGDIVSVDKKFTNESSKDHFVSKFSYDDGGRLLTQTNSKGGVKTFTYDSFNRVTEMQYFDAVDSKATYTRTFLTYDDAPNRLSFYEAKTLEYKIKETATASESTVVKVAKEYDGFARQINMKNYNPASTAAILDQRRFAYFKSVYDTATTVDSPDRTADKVETALIAYTQQPGTVKKSTNSNIYTEYAYTYHPRTALMATGTVSDKTTSAGAYTQRAKFTYAYDNRGLPTRVSREYGTSAAIATTKTYSPGGNFILEETNHLGKVQKYTYTDKGQLESVTYANLDIKIQGEYDSFGRVIAYQVTSATYCTPAQTDNIMSYVALTYSYGIEKNQSLFIYNDPVDDTEIYRYDIEFPHEELLNTIDYQRQSAAGSATNLEKHYTYTGAFMSLATSRRELFDVNENLMSTNTKTYSYKGGMLFNTVTNSNTGVEPNLTYTYAGDRMSRFQAGSSASDVIADYYGNQTTAPNLSVNYTYELDGCLRTAQRATLSTYRYEPGGALSQIEQGANSITYFYDGDAVVGEKSGNESTLYLMFGDITVGRYRTGTGTNTVEIYGSDYAGSVRSVTTFAAGGVTGTVHYDYTDFGERITW